MKKHIVRDSDLAWEEKRVPAVTPDRRGFYKLLSGEHGLQQFEARLTRIPPNESSTWYHAHAKIEEWFYVVSGTCHVNIEGAWAVISAGDSVATGPGEWHTFRNFGDQDCDILMVGINDPEDRAEIAAEPSFPSEDGKPERGDAPGEGARDA